MRVVNSGSVLENSEKEEALPKSPIAKKKKKKVHSKAGGFLIVDIGDNSKLSEKAKGKLPVKEASDYESESSSSSNSDS